MARPILFISTMEGSPWGGSEELWAGAAARLASEGRRVFASVKRWPVAPPNWNCLIASGVRLLPRPDQVDPVSVKPELAVISCGDAGQSCVGWANILRGRRVPYVVLCHSVPSWTWPNDNSVESLRVAFGSARKVLFASHQSRMQMEFLLGVSLDSSYLLTNPVKVPYDYFPAWPPGSVARIACVARLDPMYKGQDILLRVLAKPRWRERNVRVSFYGDGPGERTLRRIVSDLSIGSVEFAGARPPVEIWTREHLLVLPSRTEGLSLALIEAMLCGRPTLVTDVGDHARVVEDNVSGFVAPTPSEAALEEAMERAWTARETWQEMGRRAKSRINAVIPRDPIDCFLRELPPYV